MCKLWDRNWMKNRLLCRDISKERDVLNVGNDKRPRIKAVTETPTLTPEPLAAWNSITANFCPITTALTVPPERKHAVVHNHQEAHQIHTFTPRQRQTLLMRFQDADFSTQTQTRLHTPASVRRDWCLCSPARGRNGWTWRARGCRLWTPPHSGLLWPMRRAGETG